MGANVGQGEIAAAVDSGIAGVRQRADVIQQDGRCLNAGGRVGQRCRAGQIHRPVGEQNGVARVAERRHIGQGNVFPLDPAVVVGQSGRMRAVQCEVFARQDRAAVGVVQLLADVQRDIARCAQGAAVVIQLRRLHLRFLSGVQRTAVFKRRVGVGGGQGNVFPLDLALVLDGFTAGSEGDIFFVADDVSAVVDVAAHVQADGRRITHEGAAVGDIAGRGDLQCVTGRPDVSTVVQRAGVHHQPFFREDAAIVVKVPNAQRLVVGRVKHAVIFQ